MSTSSQFLMNKNASILAAEEDASLVVNGTVSTVTDPLAADWLSQSDKIGFLFLLSLICFVAFFGNGFISMCHIEN